MQGSLGRRRARRPQLRWGTRSRSPAGNEGGAAWRDPQVQACCCGLQLLKLQGAASTRLNIHRSYLCPQPQADADRRTAQSIFPTCSSVQTVGAWQARVRHTSTCCAAILPALQGERGARGIALGEQASMQAEGLQPVKQGGACCAHTQCCQALAVCHPRPCSPWEVAGGGLGGGELRRVGQCDGRDAVKAWKVEATSLPLQPGGSVSRSHAASKPCLPRTQEPQAQTPPYTPAGAPGR